MHLEMTLRKAAMPLVKMQPDDRRGAFLKAQARSAEIQPVRRVFW
jgi:hypothetical protein